MDHSSLIRQSDIIPQEKLSLPITIVGCGAIGSFTALALAKMGLGDIKLYDFDTVSEVNMSSQFFPFETIGTNKALATCAVLHSYASMRARCEARHYLEEDAAQTKGIVILAVDTMEARRDVFHWVEAHAMRVRYVIDPRMSAEYYEQYVVNPFDKEDRNSYMKHMHKDEDTVQQRCTAKSTVYTAMLAAGLIAKTVKNILVDEPYPSRIKWDIQSSNHPLFRMTTRKDAHADTQTERMDAQEIPF